MVGVGAPGPSGDGFGVGAPAVRIIDPSGLAMYSVLFYRGLSQFIHPRALNLIGRVSKEFSAPIRSVATLLDAMLDALLAIKSPRSQTAAMQLLQLYAQSGHVFWTSGRVERGKLARLVAKLTPFRIHRDAPGRAYDKRGGHASVHLVVLDADSGVLPWVLVSTAGRGGLADPAAPQVGPVYDTRVRGQHLRWHHYELLHMPKSIKRCKTVKFKQARDGREQDVVEERIETVHVTTWTWRVLPQRVKEHEALLASRAKHRDIAGLQGAVAALAQMPQFGGVRGQVLRLHAEARKLAHKFGAEVNVPRLPFMTRLPLYTDPPATLHALATRAAPLTANNDDQSRHEMPIGSGT